MSIYFRRSDVHDYWDENRWAKALQQDIREGFEDGIGYEEDRESSIIFASRQGMFRRTKTLLQAVDLGVADIGSVEEGEKVENAELHH
jgi:hypothetical protein